MQPTIPRSGKAIVAGIEVSPELREAIYPDFSPEQRRELDGKNLGRLSPDVKVALGRSLLTAAERGLGTRKGKSIQTAREALKFAGTLFEDLGSQAANLDDRTYLEKCFRGGTEVGVLQDPLKGKEAIIPPLPMLASIEAKMASIRGDPSALEMMKGGLYEMLTDEAYITPRVIEAIKQMIGHGFLDYPFPVGSIVYVRKNMNIDKPPSTDEGCYLLFHPPLSHGKIESNIPPEERMMTLRLPVVVEFDESGKVISVKKYEMTTDRKLYPPVNGRIHIVPAITEDEQAGREEYLYRKIAFEPTAAGARMITEVEKGVQMGLTLTEDRGYVSVYELREGQAQNGIGKAGDRFGIVHRHGETPKVVKVSEKVCPQARINGVKFGIHVEPKDAGIPLRKNLQGDINELAAEIVRYGDLGIDDYHKAKGEVTQILEELAEAVPPVSVAAGDERRRIQQRFLKDSRPIIPFLMKLKGSIENPAQDVAVPEELKRFTYAKLYQTTALMVANGRALNIAWGTESLPNFLEGYRELKEQDRMRQTLDELITARMVQFNRQQTDELTKVIQEQHNQTRWHIQEEAVRTRNVVLETSHIITDRIDSLPNRDEMLAEITTAFGEMREGLLAADRNLAEKLDGIEKDLGSSKTKVKIKGGLNLGIIGLELEKEISLGKLGDKAKAGQGRLKRAYNWIIAGIKGTGNLPEEQQQVIQQFTNLYTTKQQ